MGFMKPGRSAAGDITGVNAETAQRRAADQAERDKSGLISNSLDEDTLLRARRFGVRPLGISVGGPTTMAAGGGASYGKGSGGIFPLVKNGIVGKLFGSIFG